MFLIMFFFIPEFLNILIMQRDDIVKYLGILECSYGILTNLGLRLASFLDKI
jgi:hypothetical protein